MPDPIPFDPPHAPPGYGEDDGRDHNGHPIEPFPRLAPPREPTREPPGNEDPAEAGAFRCEPLQKLQHAGEAEDDHYNYRDSLHDLGDGRRDLPDDPHGDADDQADDQEGPQDGE